MQKKWHVCVKDYVWNPATCSYKNRKYLSSIMEDWEDSAITYDELIKSFDEEIVAWKGNKKSSV